jgi:altronate dehydratase large subunit
MRLTGYRRSDGRIGIRNHILIIPTVQCANRVVELIDAQVPEAVGTPHMWGCTFATAENHIIERTLIGFGAHPNVYATLVVSLGCETASGQHVSEAIAGSGKPVEWLTIQECGGTAKTTERGRALVEQWVADSRRVEREEFGMEELIVAVECGGSDAFSGLSANPAVGVASDLIVAAGGTVILSESSEIVGAEHLLAERCVDESVREALLNVVAGAEQRLARSNPGADGYYITPGNIEGGLTTIAEKSLGCIHKAGSTPVQEVVPYARRPSKRGLVVMDTPGYDIASVTGKVAAGTHLVLFTTGRGSPCGCPIAPVVKVCSNSTTFARMADNMDVNAGAIVDGDATLEQVGKAIFDEACQAANGKLTKAEQFGHREFAIAAPSAFYCRLEADELG